jgi:hypothetical protein
MNRAAEDAAKSAAPIFAAAVKDMSITDAFSILRGTDVAATSYLKEKRATRLQMLSPGDRKIAGKSKRHRYWTTVFTTYNK